MHTIKFTLNFYAKIMKSFFFNLVKNTIKYLLHEIIQVYAVCTILSYNGFIGYHIYFDIKPTPFFGLSVSFYFSIPFFF